MSNSSLVSGLSEASGARFSWVEVSQESLEFFDQKNQTFLGDFDQENLAPEASDRPETRLELLTRTCSVRFFPHFLISSRMKVPLKEACSTRSHANKKPGARSEVP